VLREARGRLSAPRPGLAVRVGSRLRGLGLDLLLLPLLLLASPWLLSLILVRGRGVGSLVERLGFWNLYRTDRERIWIHCVSVGELNAASPLIDALRRERPWSEIILSVTTASARAVAAARHPDLSTYHFPLDLSGAVRRVMERVRPRVLILIELELWPQLVLEASARGVPIVIANGRISARGHRRMRRLRPLLRPVLNRITEVHARDAECAERFIELGLPRERVRLLGNLKFDRAPVPSRAEVRRRFARRFGEGPLWVAGCTHPGEESAVLTAHLTLRRTRPDLRLLLAPRHVERCEGVIAEVRGRGLSVARESEVWSAQPPPEVIVVDRTGVLAELYAVGDVAFVGGSWIEHGGQNILEPLLAGAVPLHGPHMENFREVVDLLRPAGVASCVGRDGLAAAIDALMDDEAERERRLGEAERLLAGARGAAERSARRIGEWVDEGATRAEGRKRDEPGRRAEDASRASVELTDPSR